ncbi:MAG: tetratricopeptide repeat protein [Gammaproteobacteria bacterium]|jgi:MSHA biogenesis protein MshN|nr:tetratricopeptide repeat protein [Gammaproteobacteria bacterium]
MSLINQVLKDLDKRRRHGESSADKGIPAGVEELSTPRALSNKSLGKFSFSTLGRWVLLLLLGILIGILTWQYLPSAKRWGLSVLGVQSRQEAEAKSTLETQYQLLETVLEQAAKPQQQGNHLLTLAATEQLVDTLEKTDDSSNPLPTPSSKTAVVELVSDLVKKTRELTPLERATQSYAQALRMAEHHDIAGATTLLQQVLDEIPEFQDARETLAAIYIQQKDTLKANELLEAGLAIDPDYPRFVSLQARIQVAEGKLSQALAMLSNLSPPVSEYPDYYAFLAALHQQNGDYLVSAKIYDELSAIQPDNGLWWLGKAIGLNAAGQPQEALKAYRHAQISANLTPPLRAYIDEQIKSLE